MTDISNQLREMIREVVREELARIRDEHDRGAEFLSTATAANLADVTSHTVRRWIREGKLDAYGTGSRLRVRRGDLERLVGGHRREGESLTPEQLALRKFG